MINRDELQDDIAQAAFIAKKGIIKAAMRFGKTRVGVKILQKLPSDSRVLITYPDNVIKQSWLDEFEKMGYNNPNLVLSSNMSMNKYEDEKWDCYIGDECHKLSERNKDSVESILRRIGDSGRAYLMSGSIPDRVYEELSGRFKLTLIASYEQERAIDDKIISDYRINVIRVPLDNQRLIQYKRKKRTEKQQFNSYSWIIDKLQAEGKETFYLRLARMRIIQSSIAKMEATRKLIRRFKGERLLVFCGLIKIAEQLGIPVEHSKSKDDNLDKFIHEEIDEIAVIRMGAMGKTFPKLNRVIINYFDSNETNLQQKIGRAMNLEFKDKVADIWIVCSTEDVERKWLDKALTPFDKSKITYL